MSVSSAYFLQIPLFPLAQISPDTTNVCSYIIVTSQVSHPYKTTEMEDKNSEVNHNKCFWVNFAHNFVTNTNYIICYRLSIVFELYQISKDLLFI